MDPRHGPAPALRKSRRVRSRRGRGRDLHRRGAPRGRRAPHGEGADRRAGRRSRCSPPRRAVGAGEVERFTHGTTVATNALLERKGARTAFVATAGFEHLLHLRRQNRAHLYRLCAAHPEPLVPLERCHGVRERHRPRRRARAARARLAAGARDAEAVAVCLLFSFRDPSHERRGRGGAAAALPGAHVVASHELVAGVPRVRAGVDDRDRRLPRRRSSRATSRRSAARRAARDCPEPLVMRSSGGVATLAEAAAHPARRARLGPGRRASSAPARVAGAPVEDAIAFDMGGTSTDVCLIRGGAARRAARSARSAACRSGCRRSTCTRSARAAARSSGATRAARCASGPRAPGADPGRPATDAAGRAPTVTDANLLLGRLPARLAGRPRARPRRGRARARRDRPGRRRSRSSTRRCCARSALVSVERGHDPRDFALVAFGGAGPLHACALAEELGIETVLVPEAAGVLSALGLVVERRAARLACARTSCPLAEAGELPREGEADLRYRGQSFELTVPLQPGLAEAFHRAHEERYGYADRDRARSSSSPSAPPTCARARRSTSRAASRSSRRARRVARARRAPRAGCPPAGSGREDGRTGR